MEYKIEPVDYTVTLRATDIKERIPMAFASLDIVVEDGKKIGKLVGLMRHPDFSGVGICLDLIKEIIKIAKVRGCDYAYIAIYHKRLGIIKQYQKLKFIELPAITPEFRIFIKELK